MRKFATGRALRGAVCLTGLLVLGGCGMFSGRRPLTRRP